MRLATLRAAAGTSAACDAGDGWRELPYADVGALLRDPAWRERVSSGALCREPGRDAFQPLIPAPGKIVCCGHNYTEHIRELGRELPSHPTLFAKFADTLCGPYDDIEVSAAPEMVDWEAELAVVVGARVRGADRDAAREAIAGYTVANDISMRDWQRRTSQWLQGKAFSGTTPLGPVLVTADSIDPSGGLEISCSVNGEIVQRADTATLVFDAPELVSYISRFTTLNPGDVILTGTPGGVGAAMDPPRFLGDDDLLTTTISGIGTLQNRIRRCRPASHPHSAASHPHSTKKHEEKR